MNTGKVKNTITTVLPQFPALVPNKRNSIVTKHLTNTVLYLPHDMSAMLIWLVYVCREDNTLDYSTQLLRRYCMAIFESNKLYGAKKSRKKPNGLTANVVGARYTMIKLIEQGYVIRLSEKKILLNPMLRYSKYLSSKEYNKIMADYQELVISEESKDFFWKYISLVNLKINGEII